MTGELTESDLQQVLAERDVCLAAGDRLGYAKALMVLEHVVKWVRSDTEEPPFVRSQKLALEALEVFRAEGDAAGQVDALCHSMAFDPPDIRNRKMDEALQLAESLDNQRLIAHVLSTKARAAALTNKAEAMELNRRVLAIYKSLDMPAGVGQILFSMAIASTESDEIKWEYARQSAAAFKEAGRPRDALRSTVIALMEGEGAVDPQLLKEEAMAGLALAQAVGETQKEMTFYAYLSRICIALGDPVEAAKYHRWHHEMESADGLTDKERERQRKREAREIAALAKSMGHHELAKALAQPPKRSTQ